jgi:hypothetical protein
MSRDKRREPRNGQFAAPPLPDRALFTAANRQQLVKAAVEQTAVRYRCAGVLLVDRDPGALPIAYSTGFDERFLKARIRLCQGSQDSVRGRPGYRLTADGGAGATATTLLRPFGLRACVQVPLTVPASDHGHGCKYQLELYFDTPQVPAAAWSADITAWSALLTAAISAHLEREALDRENRELLMLARVSQTVAASLDLEHVFESIYRQLLRLMKPRNVLLALAEPEQRRFRVIFEYEHGKKGKKEFFPMGPGLATVIWKKKQAIVTPDYLA